MLCFVVKILEKSYTNGAGVIQALWVAMEADLLCGYDQIAPNLTTASVMDQPCEYLRVGILET